MIDIVQAVQAADPSLGARVIVLRADSRALGAPDRLAPEAAAWIAEHAADARLARPTILLAPHPGAVPVPRVVTVMAFTEARQLAAFATAWTAEPDADARDDRS
ncbi:hypothetical protein [uncultured Methylobacterium sp.]|uniref:hypothetical protein n=1 Tax=uncultured Methylobacterium sp. TaxID=157278 RepID=UPI0035CCA3E8